MWDNSFMVLGALKRALVELQGVVLCMRAYTASHDNKGLP
jgi:hypothetical protein